jgi:quercetin dioxygenase-like cupin family protein
MRKKAEFCIGGKSMSVKHTNDVPVNVVKNGDMATMQVLISAQEGPHFAMRRFIMEPGGGMPNHTNTLEHEQYVLRGHATIGIGEEEFEVKAGDVVFIPEGVPHWYQNIGEENFEFLCMIPNQEDTIKLIEKEC